MQLYNWEIGPDTCPCCKGMMLYRKQVRDDINTGRVRRRLRCHECGAAWDQVYQVAGYELVEKGNGF